ncbi:MAG: hypothetical protein ACK5JM_05930 [Rhodoblastus sp.]
MSDDPGSRFSRNGCEAAGFADLEVRGGIVWAEFVHRILQATFAPWRMPLSSPAAMFASGGWRRPELAD